MDNQNLKIVNTLGKSNQRTLLKAFEHRNINDAMKHYTGVTKKKYTEQEKQHAYELMRDDYNAIVRNLQQEVKEEKTQIKRNAREYQNENNAYERALKNIDITPVSSKRVKPTVDVTNKFKKSSKQIVVNYPSNKPDIENGYESLQILNHAIPEIRNAMNEYKGIKIHVVFHLNLIRNEANTDGTKEIKDLPSAVPIQTITNINEVNTKIQELIATMRQRIPEIEKEKSGWRYLYTSKIDVNVMKYEPLKGGSYLPLPTEINAKKCCINIKNDDDKCLMYSVLYHIHKDEIKDHP